MKRAYLIFAIACVAGCSSAQKPEPASAAALARPVATPAARDSSSDVNVAPEIAKACNLPTPHFAFDSASIEPDAGLDRLATCFTSGPMKGRRMKLVGHADPRGETEYNFELGQKRAGGVESYLERHDLAKQYVSASSRGELDAKGTNEATWAEDRRVDVLLGD